MRLIDADALKAYGQSWKIPMDAYRDINLAPTIDAVPVIRCKDCKHYWKNYVDGDSNPVCLATPSDDAFCSEGERRYDDKR